MTRLLVTASLHRLRSEAVGMAAPLDLTEHKATLPTK
jgi:hypothetical protein